MTASHPSTRSGCHARAGQGLLKAASEDRLEAAVVLMVSLGLRRDVYGQLMEPARRDAAKAMQRALWE